MFTDKENANQIMKVHSRGSFVEVLSSSFPIRKVQMNFRSYDKSNRVTDSINVYLNIENLLPLMNKVKSGAFVQEFINAKQTGQYKGSPINQYTSYYTDQGGSVKGNEVVSRVFKIQESTKPGSWNLYAAEGPGKVTGTGLIQMDGRPKVFINIPVTNDQLVAMMIKIEMHLQAYTNLVYAKFGNRIFTKLFSGDKSEEYTSYFYENPVDVSGGNNQGNQAQRGYNYPPAQNQVNAPINNQQPVQGYQQPMQNQGNMPMNNQGYMPNRY